MRRFITPALGLLFLSLALVFIHLWQGMTTDEAKYLLNIPYPHPPLMRWLIGQTGWEFFWRVILAIVLLQAAELARAFAPVREKETAFLLAGFWVLSAAVFVSAGQILLAPVTALQMLVFCYWFLKGEDLERIIGWMALLWLASLFTAYQAILFLPVVAAVFWRMKLPFWQRMVALGGPVLLLALYTAMNPLAAASMVTASGQNLGGGSVFAALRGAVWLWVLGGSFVLSVLGTIGMFVSLLRPDGYGGQARRWPLIVSLLFVFAFIFLSFRPYYSILFTPLLIAGVASSPALLRKTGTVLIATLVCALVLVPISFPKHGPSPVAAVYAAAEQAGIPAGATAIVSGSFGHEWQYGPYVVHRMVRNLQLLDSARIAVCLTECPDIRGRAGWRVLTGVPMEVWVRTIR